MNYKLCTCLIGILTLFVIASCSASLTHLLKNAYAQVDNPPYIYTLSDQASCEALPVSGGTAVWDSSSNTCTIDQGTLTFSNGQYSEFDISGVALKIGSSAVMNVENADVRIFNEGQLIVDGTVNIKEGGTVTLFYKSIDISSGGTYQHL